MANNTLAKWAPVPLRIVMGVGFTAHGWAKWSRGPGTFGNLLHQVGVPLPEFTAWAVILPELIGGGLLIIGAFVAIVSVPLIISMLVTIFTINGQYGFSAVKTICLSPGGPIFGPLGYQINLLYIAGLLMLIAAGAGPLSVDRWLRHKNE